MQRGAKAIHKCRVDRHLFSHGHQRRVVSERRAGQHGKSQSQWRLRSSREEPRHLIGSEENATRCSTAVPPWLCVGRARRQKQAMTGAVPRSNLRCVRLPFPSGAEGNARQGKEEGGVACDCASADTLHRRFRVQREGRAPVGRRLVPFGHRTQRQALRGARGRRGRHPRKAVEGVGGADCSGVLVLTSSLSLHSKAAASQSRSPSSASHFPARD
jgi:hypothetical protein